MKRQKITLIASGIGILVVILFFLPLMLVNIVPFENRAKIYGLDNYKLIQSSQSDLDSVDQVQKLSSKQFSINQSSFNDRIIINDNVDLTDQARISGWPGNGSKSNPFTIVYLNISNHDNLIIFRNTNLHLKITNCSLFNATIGILFENVTNVFISNNILGNNQEYGIQIISSSNITLYNNSVSNSLQGVRLSFSQNITISNNNITDNIDAGIFLDSSGNNLIINNSLDKNGIVFNSTHLDDFLQTEVSNNYVNGKPLIFWQNITNGNVPKNVGQIILVNCTSVTVSEQNIADASIGIIIAYCNDLIIVNNSINYNSRYGIFINSSINSILLNNVISYNGLYGITLESCKNITVSSNFVFNNIEGVFLKYSRSNNIFNNFVYNNDIGFSFLFSRYNYLARNTIYNNIDKGVFFLSSNSNRIFDNFLINNGLIVNGSHPDDFWQSEVTNNLVNGKPLIFWQNVTNGKVPRDAGQVILVNCTKTTISNQYFVNASIGLFVAYCTELIIRDNLIANNNQFGAYIYNSSNNKILSNSIKDNGVGIKLYNSGNNTINSNTLTNNGLVIFGEIIEHYLQTDVSSNKINEKQLIYWQNERNATIPQNTAQIILINCSLIEVTGLILSNVSTSIFAAYSSNLAIQNNRIFDNIEGIKLVDSMGSTLTNNFIFDNKNSGIVFENSNHNVIIKNSISHNGFSACMLIKSRSNTISTNSIYNNGLYGVVLELSDENWVINNYISDSQMYGVDIRQSENNSINKNNYIGNNPNANSQANDQDNEGQMNQFSNNYWDNLEIKDENKDGIHDQNYFIDGSSNNTDPLPKIELISIQIYLLTTPVIVYPKAGSILQEDVLIEWETSYSYGTPTVYYVIYYTLTDIPYIWNTLVTGLTNTSYVWNTRLVQDGSTYKLAVEAYDSENLRSIHVLYQGFSIINSPSTELSLIKILIILNTIIIALFIFISTLQFVRSQIRKRTKWYSKDFIINYLQQNSKSSIIRGKWLLMAILTAFFLSVLRAWLIDPKLVVNDGYDSYARWIRYFLYDLTSSIDEESFPKIRFRITYPTLIALLLPSITPFNIVFIGRLISIISFFLCIFYLGKLLEHFKSLSESRNKEKILIVFILNPTIITNIVRFETDILFLALSFYILSNYLNLIDKKSNNLQKLNLVLAIILFIFTREVGIFLLVSLLIHSFILIPRKFKYLIISSLFFLTIIGFWLNILQNFVFYALWSASTYTYAYEIIYKNNWLVFIDIIFLKVTNEYIFSKTIESIFYAFFPVVLFFVIGIIRFYNSENKLVMKKALLNIISIYFLIYILFYLVLKSGRGLDRFWIPILAFPILVLPNTIDLNDLKSRIIHLIRYRYNSNKPLVFSSELKPSIDNKDAQITSMKDIPKRLIPKNTYIFIIIIQLVIYLVRLILSQISNLFILGIR